MKAFKDKQFLVFEFEDGKNVKYNLATHECIGKLGKPVKDIKTQLRGYELLDVIESFQDENYRNFLNFIDKRVNTSKAKYRRGRVDKITNIGSFLKQIGRYSKYEQFFSSGIKAVEYPLRFEFKDIPRGMFKFCKEYGEGITNHRVYAYMDHPDLFNVLMKLELNTLRKKQILDLLTYSDKISKFGNRWKMRFYELINQYNYKPQNLIKHIDGLMTYEAINDFEGLIDEFYDYVVMMSTISNKYEKYPKNFLTTHRIASRNYNRLKTEFSEEVFKNRIDNKLEYKYDNYIMIYPKTTSDIKDEAVQQNNCVASYIQKVLDGKCHILFLRHKDNPGKSLVTVEIRNGVVVQALGKFNRGLSEGEKKFIEKYNNRLERMKKVC